MKMNDLMIYQIFPLRAFAGEGTEHGILEVKEWIPHIKKIGMNAIYFSPVFSSSNHGYDTKDFRVIDERLGTNEDFKEACKALKEAGIKVILDGVFNHVGREFWAFQDVLEKKWDSPYKDWFYINFDGNSSYDDGFWYEGWEGHFELVKLNLDNDQVKQHLLDAVSLWIDEFGIDGLRLDVAYMLNRNFIKCLVDFVRSKNPDFLMIGEMLHGDYSQLANPDLLDSVTNYECYKGLYSSFNTHNMHEIGYSLNRQFGPEEWTLYKGIPLYNFVDNHDVERIASQLNEKDLLPLIYAMMFGMPGVPGVYYGSEWGIEGKKEQGSDDSLRPRIKPEELKENELAAYIGKLAQVRKNSPALRYGDYRQLAIMPDVLVFQRQSSEDRIIVAINIGNEEYTAHFDARAGQGTDLISGELIDFGGGLLIPAKKAFMIRTEEVSIS
ncbi:alpha-amylase family glycosyl hydrolase [Anaerostipes sp.]|uniref:alpha-amylase family glycosyl hydrolase n=1 Tax=Anaerostipes sp. TaxID=1872530 RepID=UPI0025883361|nr:alpha-amylase family glycosyl hydrolase [Anaerostipes sp.]MCI5622971.1 alpha-amylase family glycosyl hydrolase [Anaerostipes sp.]